MAKQSGLGDNLYIDGFDYSGDFQGIPTISKRIGAVTQTDITQSGMARAGTHFDGEITYVSYFNPSAGRAHANLSTLPRTDRMMTYCRGTVLGSPSASLIAKQLNYDPTREQDGQFTVNGQNLGNAYGLEWGKLLTAGKRTDTGAANGTGVSFGAGSTNFGLQAYLQVFSFTGTDVTIEIEESSDDDTDAYVAVTGAAFTEVDSAPFTERLQTARDLTVERFLRVATSTTGGFSELTFAVMAIRNNVLVNF